MKPTPSMPENLTKIKKKIDFIPHGTTVQEIGISQIIQSKAEWYKVWK
jgi:hypothetical protein